MGRNSQDNSSNVKLDFDQMIYLNLHHDIPVSDLSRNLRIPYDLVVNALTKFGFEPIYGEGRRKIGSRTYLTIPQIMKEKGYSYGQVNQAINQGILSVVRPEVVSEPYLVDESSIPELEAVLNNGGIKHVQSRAKDYRKRFLEDNVNWGFNFRRYLLSVPPLKDSEVKELFGRVQNGDESAVQEVVEANLRFVYNLASH